VRDIIPDIQGYAPKDVLNCDETGCNFRAKPCRTLATAKASGMKISKDRFTAMMLCSCTGEKFWLLIIHHVRRPHTFKRENFNPENYVRYAWNKKAWMNSEVCTCKDRFPHARKVLLHDYGN
jgi:hypothetical protein